MGFLALLLTLSISGWWLVRNYILYDDPLLQRTFLEVFAGTAKAQDFLDQGMTWGQYAQLVADWTFRSFWFAYGVPETARTGLPNFLPGSVYLGLGALMLGAVVGFVLCLREPSPAVGAGVAAAGGAVPAADAGQFRAVCARLFPDAGTLLLPRAAAHQRLLGARLGAACA
jgi:hypothetical protein